MFTKDQSREHEQVNQSDWKTMESSQSIVHVLPRLILVSSSIDISLWTTETRNESHDGFVDHRQNKKVSKLL